MAPEMKKPPPPQQQQPSLEEEEEVEDSGEAIPEGNALADEAAAASLQPKKSEPSGEVSEERTQDDSGEASAETDSPPIEFVATSSPLNKRGASSPVPKRVKKRAKPSTKLPPRSKEAGNTSPPQEKDGAVNSGEALPERRNASSAKLPDSKREKKPAAGRSWSMEDELRILTALAEHAQTHDGALLEASDLFAALAASFDRRDADTDKLPNKIRKLRGRHGRVRSQGCPTDDHGRRLFELCETVWGSGALHKETCDTQGASLTPRRSLRKASSFSHVVPEEGGGGGEHTDALAEDVGACEDNSVPIMKDGDVNSGKFEDGGGQFDEDEQAKATFVRREFSELSRLYPDLAKEVKGYAASHSSGESIMEAFGTIGDDEARDLDARCKKQRIDTFNLEMSQADLTKALLCTLAPRIN